MKDLEYSELKLKASIAPEQLRWPEPKFTHWARLHDAVNKARELAGRAHSQIDTVERDVNLSDEGKRSARSEIAKRIIGDLEKGEALEQARTAVKNQLQRWEDKFAEHIKPPTDSHSAMLHSKILDRVASMDAPARVAFLQKHGSDPLVASALLASPAFISGLGEAEIALVRSQFEKRVMSPEIIEAREATVKALGSTERGYRSAIALVTERGKIAPVTKIGKVGKAA